jgi:hypothetical protein
MEYRLRRFLHHMHALVTRLHVKGSLKAGATHGRNHGGAKLCVVQGPILAEIVSATETRP